ncbi:MAG: glycoside hydrolase family 97 catalytic domain-containing protein, partial [Planctomycetales bacterium]|nr:glycoside hydrolase family 97 catalytic domain-containing protein [Planctomycetales bacterium]
ASHNFQYIEFDAGWYGHEYDDASDASTVTVDPKRSPGPLDLHAAIEYAAKKNIGVILYVNRRALERQLAEILPLYREWGVKGVKFGFVNTGSQHWTAWLHEAIRKAAEHKLMVDVHDEYRPTGYSRTYPNLMTQEGVRGDEATPSSEQAIITLFTRNLAGAADHTICYFDSRVDEHWTHGHQLAKAVCTYSPWQFAFWYDSPPSDGAKQRPRSRIVPTPELELFAKVPTVWDETRVVHSEVGDYVAIARRSGREWFVGAMNGPIARELSVPLDFLDAGSRYQARIYADAPDLETRTRIRIDDQQVDAATRLSVNLLANGGQAIWIKPAAKVEQAAAASPAEKDPRLHSDGSPWGVRRAQIEDSTRPRVLLIGDSILNGYRQHVVQSLKDDAYVDAWVNPYHQGPQVNRALAEALRNGPYDVVHFNIGLHGWQEGRIEPGAFKPLTRAYVEVLQSTLPDATLIWASSTPVTMEGDPSQLESQINPIIVEHNRLAAEVMREMHVPVNDFYDLLVDRRELARGDRFHWTSPAYAL